MSFWIGDRVWITSLKQEGIFEGEQAEMAVVKVDGTKLLVHFADLTVLPEEDDAFLEFFDEEEDIAPVPFSLWDNEIDLHIEVLNPALKSAEAAQILAHQVSRMKDFVTRAIARQSREILIIHGKGEGVLKGEVISYLKSLSEMKEILETGDGGAVKVIF